MLSSNSEEARLMEIVEPYLDYDKMNDMFEEDEDAYYEYQDELTKRYGMSIPLVKDAPTEIITAYKRLGAIRKEQEKSGEVM